MNPIPYIAARLENPPHLEVPTGWNPCETIIADIIERFDVTPNFMLEFGVEYGFSTSVFAHYFDAVIGVDWFKGDEHSGGKDLYDITADRLRAYRHVAVERFNYKDWIAGAGEIRADMIHVDIVHTFLDTYRLGRWAVDHSDVVLFHDTLSFPSVMQAVKLISAETGISFYNHDNINGLGILSRKAV